MPVPRLPGPWATTATSALERRAGRRAAPVCSGDRLQVAAEGLADGDRSRPASRRRAGRRRCGRTRPAARRRRSSRRPPGHAGPVGARTPATIAGRARVQVGDDHRHPGQVVGVRAAASWCGESCSSTPEHHRLQRRVAGLDQVPRAGRQVGREPVGQRDDQRVPPVPSPRSSARGVEQHRGRRAPAAPTRAG